MADSNRTRASRRRRRWLFIAGGVLLGLLIVIALLPTLVSAGLGQELIRQAIDERVDGDVAIDQMRFRWLGGQELRGLKIVDPQRGEVAKVDLKVDSTLLAIVFKQPGPLDVTVSGRIRGEIGPDGSLSLAGQDTKGEAAATMPGATQPTAPAIDEPFQLPELPQITLRMENVDVVIDEAGSQLLALNNVKGRFRFETFERPIALNFEAITRAGGVDGHLEIKGLANDLFDYNGRLKLREAMAELDVAGENLAIPATFAQQLGLADDVVLQTLTMSLASDDLTQDVVASLSAQVQAGNWPDPGQIQAQLAASKVLGNRGELNPQGSTVHGSMTLANVPVAAGDVNALVQQMNATLASDDLSRVLHIGVDGTTLIEGHEPSPLMARLTVDQPFTSDGRFDFNLARLTGTASGSTIPATLVQPLLQNTAIVAQRDIGPTLDVQAAFSQGETKDISLNVAGGQARLEMVANVNPETRAIDGSHLLIVADAVHPDLVRDFTNAAIASDGPFDLELRLTSFTYPAAGEVPQLARAAAQGSLHVSGPAAIRLAAQPGADAAAAQAFQIRNLRTEFNSPGLAERLDVSGSLRLDGAQVTFEERISGLFDAEGRLAIARALPEGSLQVQGLPASTIARFAPQHQALIDAAVGRALDATVSTDQVQGNLRAAVSATAAAFGANVTAVREPDALRLEGGQIVATLSPELARALQPEAEQPIVLARPANLTIDLQPATFPADPEDGYGLPAQEPLRAVVNVASADIENPPGLTQPLRINDVIAELQLMREGRGMALTAAGDAELRAGSEHALLTRARYSIKAVQRDEQTTVHGDIGLADLSVAALERAMGKPAGAWSQWTGDSGRLSAHLETGANAGAWTAHVRPDLPNLSGDFAAQSDGAMMSLSASNGSLTLTRAALERRMNPAADAPPAGDAAGRVMVEGDLPVTFSIEQLQVPLRGDDGAMNAAAAQMRLQANSTQPLTLVNPDGTRTTLEQLSLSFESPALSEGVSFALRGEAKSDAPARPVSASGGPHSQSIANRDPQNGAAAAAAESAGPATQPAAGGLNVTGRITNLVGEDQSIQLADARLVMDAQFNDVPTAVVDAVMNLQGLLTAAVGGRMNAAITATDFSANTGRMDVDVRTTNGELKTQLRGREGALRIPPDPPLTAQLEVTPALRERLLERIHPLLADIRSAEHPLRATVASGVLPMSKDGEQTFDISGLRADIEINVGPVEFESGSTTLALLRLFNEADRRTIPGEIEPIVAKIRNGVIRYDQFAVKIDKYTLRYSGEINLVNQTVDVRTELPLEALATTFQELEGYADKIVVPLVTQGKFGQLKTQIDPKFDIGKAALDAGLGGALDNILKQRGSSLNDLLDQLNRPRPRRQR